MPRQRWTMIFLCFLACTINYVDRANLAVAAPYLRKEFGIDAATMGVILSGFFWTYAVMQMPFGWFADKVGPRTSLTIAVVWWSVFTATHRRGARRHQLAGLPPAAGCRRGRRLSLLRQGRRHLVPAQRAQPRHQHLR